MDAGLFQRLESTRAAASQAVASGLAPRSRTQTSGASTALAGTKSIASGLPKAAATTGTGSTTGTSTAASTDPSTITSSDFLTLLVTELKNQDPTQPTDPNAYITQLVQVNSLEQLININSGISTLDTSVSPTTTTGTTTGSTGSTTGSTGSTTPATGSSLVKHTDL